MSKTRNRKSRIRQLKQQKRGQRRGSSAIEFSFESLESRTLLAGVIVGNALDLVNAPDVSSISALIANDGGDGISLREAITAANNTSGSDTITFDATVFNGEASDVIRLQTGQLVISEALHINAGAQEVVISGDAMGNDTLVSGTFITDIAASETAGVLGDNNGRILNVTAPVGDEVRLTGLTITGGNATGFAGGIISNAASLVIENSSISGNRATLNGGGIGTGTGAVTLTSSTVSGNSTLGSNSDGGGIFTSSGVVTLASSTVSGNSTTGFNADGGGIFTLSGSVMLSRSTVSGNTTTGNFSDGGGIRTDSGVVTLTSSTVSGNSTLGNNTDGGGIRTNSGAVTLASSTVTGNSSGRDGGGIYVSNTATNPTVTIQNSIVAGNMASGSAPDLVLDPGSTLDFDFSLFGDNAGTTLAEAQSPDTNGNLIGSAVGSGIIDPLLGALADNGGPTLTHALLPGSPAIDAGDPAAVAGAGNTPLFDQRGTGFDRVRGRQIDMGAFEVQSDVLLLSSTTSGNVGGVQFADEDILAFDSSLGTWSMFFDGSDVGLRTRDIDAFHVLTGGDILLSLNAPLNIDGLGRVDDSDILRFIAVTTGDETSGTFELFFDGSDVGLTTGAEDIDAISVDASGTLIVSTIGTANVLGLQAFDEDLLMFTATAFGADTTGTWSLYFDGSDVGLQTGAEDLSAAIVESSTSDLLLSTNGNFNIPNLTGQGGDVWRATPSSLGSETALSSVSLMFDASSTTGFERERVDGMSTFRGLLPSTTASIVFRSAPTGPSATDLTTITLKTAPDSIAAPAELATRALRPVEAGGEWSIRSWVGNLGDTFGKWWADGEEV